MPMFTFLVLSPEGEFLGTTTMPDAGSVSRGHLLTMAEDPETGEHLPTVYRIRAAVPGLGYE